MKIARTFNFKNGVSKRIEEETEKTLMEIAKVVIFKGIPFEWLMYDNGMNGISFELIYHEIPEFAYDRYNVDEILSLEPLESDNSYQPKKCGCGAKSLGIKDYQKGHSSWCPVYEDT